MTTLRPGHHLYRADDAWRCAAPGDRFVRIGGPAAELTAFQALVHGADGHRAPGADPAGVAQLRQLFADRGLLADAATTPEPPPPRLLLCGDGPVSAAVATVLAPWTDPVRLPPDVVDEGAVARADILIDCSGWLPDTRWRELDRWCAAGDTAWHRCHAEGTAFMLGPFTVPGRTAGYTDLRGRRLAASGVPDELIAHWHYLDTAGVAGRAPAPPVAWPGAGVLAVIAGLLVDDVARWWRTGRTEPVAHQVEVRTDPVTLHRHPVLPLPPTAGANPAPGRPS